MRFLVGSLMGLLLALPGFGQIQREYQYDVVPTENITSLEVNPSVTVVDNRGGISTSQLMFKGYRVINEHYNWGVEVPLARYESPDKSVNGLGDTAVNATWVVPGINEHLGMGAKMEFFVPTATHKQLGSGKLQASPSAFVVWKFDNGIYVAGGYKHYVSLLGDNAREDISYGRFRLNISYLSNDKWWIQTNAYYYQDFRHSGRTEFVPEVELGTLVSQGTAFFINGTTHGGGNWKSRDWGLGVGFKVLYL